MNKTEPVREGKRLRDFGTSGLRKCGSSEVTNFDIVRTDQSTDGGVRNFQTSYVTDSTTAELPNSETSRLAEGIDS